jgi:hypothetical protein
MRATLEYDLPNEQYEFHTAVEGSRMRAVLEQLDKDMRTRIKFDPISEDAGQALQWARMRILQLCEEHNVHLHGGIE